MICSACIFNLRTQIVGPIIFVFISYDLRRSFIGCIRISYGTRLRYVMNCGSFNINSYFVAEFRTIKVNCNL